MGFYSREILFKGGYYMGQSLFEVGAIYNN